MVPLQNWSRAVKNLIFTFVLITFIGVVAGGVMIEVTTHLTPAGVTTQFRGTDQSQMDTVGEIKFPKPLKDMLITTHNHILGLSTIFLIVGFLYLSTGRESFWHIATAMEPFISLIVTFGGLWIVRYLWPPFVYIVILSGTLMITSFSWMSFIIMKSCLESEVKKVKS